MSLADIKTKITAEAQEQIRAIEAENDDQVAVIRKKSDADIKHIQDSYKERLVKEEPEVLKRREIVARLDAKKLDLGMRQRLADEAFEASLRQMAALEQGKYVAFVEKLLAKASATGREVLFVGKKEKYIDKAWIEKFNASHQTSLTLSTERLSISGGFVLRNGKIDTNCSWEMLLKDARADLESDVIRRLFP